MNKTETFAYIAKSATIGESSATVAKVTGTFTVLGSLTNLNDLGIIIGMVCGLGALLIGWYYKHQAYKMQQRYYAKKHNHEPPEIPD